MILLDTNILAELMRAAPEKGVEQWLAEQPDASVFISAITEAELRYGVALLPAGKRRTALAAGIEDMLGEDFTGRILPLTARRLWRSRKLRQPAARLTGPSPRPMRRLPPSHGRAVLLWRPAMCLISKGAE